MRPFETKHSGTAGHNRRNTDGEPAFLKWYRPPLYDLEQAYELHRIRLKDTDTMPPFRKTN